MSKLIFLFSIFLLLTSCGGGGSDPTSDSGGSNPPANKIPTVNAGNDQTVNEQTSISLTATATDSDGSISSYSWTQTAGTTVTLSNGTSASASFTAPDINADETLTFKVTVTDNEGASATDTVQITILNVAITNQPPSANAGAGREVLEASVVMLDGSASFDSDGSISSYNWQQINNGAPVLTISNETTASASIELPGLSNNVEFAFRLTVTDNVGDTGQDEVIITGRPTPSVTVSDVSGNTATFNSAAEFSVQLANQPSFNVTIPVSSSDELEGIPEQSELTFTPENWQQAQTVVVRGTNDNVQNGEQDYQIILGSATSSDVFYDSIDPNDVNLKGIELSISQPETLYQLIAGSEATLQPQVTYTGNNQLSFSLTESPQGMNIDLSSAEITWTPQVSDEGQSYTVGISVNDGNKISATSFQVTVAAPEPVTTEVDGNTLSVVDSSTTLNGMTITTQSAQDLLAFALAKLSVSSVPEVPDWITPLTDVFVVRGRFESNLELRFPIANRPANVSLSDISLYAYSEATDVDGKFWSPVSIDINFEGTIDSPVIVIDLGGLEGIAFLGYAAPQAQSSNSTAQSSFSKTARKSEAYSATAASVGPVSCEQQFALGKALDTYICTSSEDDDIQITVEGFGGGDRRWGGFVGATKEELVGATKEELVVWLLDAQVAFLNSSLGFDKKLKVTIHEMEENKKGKILGYVTTKEFEQRKTLHISSDNAITISDIKGTAVHEYFHHAQGHPDTKKNERDLLIDGDSRNDWLIEGTARWFEDELYDSLDTYVSLEERGYRILEDGINSRDYDTGTSRPYQRFSFFKFLTSSCPSFVPNIKSALNVELATDPSGIVNTSDNFESWSCNFGSHLGSGKSSSLEAALVYYNYATQFRDDLSLFDANESGSNFKFEKPLALFDKPWFEQVESWLTGIENQVHKLNGVSYIPAAGAYSFKIPEISGELPVGKVAELVVEVRNPGNAVNGANEVDEFNEIIVSITSEDNDFVGTNTIRSSALGADSHHWFSTVKPTKPDQTVNKSSYIYDAKGTVPELFVTLVNPSLDDGASVNVYFKIRDSLPSTMNVEYTNTIKSMQNGTPIIEDNGATTLDCAIDEYQIGFIENYSERWDFDFTNGTVTLMAITNEIDEDYSVDALYNTESQTISLSWPTPIKQAAEGFYTQGTWDMDISYQPEKSSDNSLIFEGQVIETDTTSWDRDSRSVTCRREWQVSIVGQPAL